MKYTTDPRVYPQRNHLNSAQNAKGGVVDYYFRSGRWQKIVVKRDGLVSFKE